MSVRTMCALQPSYVTVHQDCVTARPERGCWCSDSLHAFAQQGVIMSVIGSKPSVITR